MRARPLSDWPRVYCARESPLPVICTFYSQTSCGCFLSLQSLSLFMGYKLLSAKKRRDHCEMATDCSFAKNLFLRLLSCQTIGLLEFLFPKFNSNYYYGGGTKKISVCHSNQILIENVAADIDFLSSVHFYHI